MKYTHQQIDETTGRIAFLFRQPSGNRGYQPTIDRIHFNLVKDPVSVPGFILRSDNGSRCALIVAVQRRDLIVIKENVSGTASPIRSFYRVDDNFEPQALDFPDREPTYEEWFSLIEIYGAGDIGQASADDGIRAVMADSNHPDWLAEIVASQLARWRKEEPELLFRFAPTSLADGEIPRCVAEAPEVALAYLQGRLSGSQLARCIDACPKDAIRLAFGRMTPLQIQDAVENHPKELLAHAAGQLSNAQLRTCAVAAPYDAFCLRSAMPAEQSAILLARSFDSSWIAKFGHPDPDLHVEILNSLMDFPEEWLGCHANDCELIFKKLWRHVQLKITPKQMLVLLRVMPEDQYPFLLESIAVML